MTLDCLCSASDSDLKAGHMSDQSSVIITFFRENKELISGLAGVILGGLLTYVASIRLERVKAMELVRRLHCLLFMEIYGHTIELNRVIDFALPSWLHRGDPAIWKSGGLPADFPIHYLSSFCFDSFIEQLAYSPLLVPITNYYQGVKELNGQIKYFYEEETADTESIMRNCYGLLEASILAIEDVLATKGIEEFFTQLIKNRLADYRLYKKDYLYRTALAKRDYANLLKWANQLESGQVPNDLPALFAQDKGNLLMVYFRQASAL